MHIAWFEIFTILLAVGSGAKFYGVSLQPYPRLYRLAAALAMCATIYGVVHLISLADTSRRYISTEWARQRELVDREARRVSDENSNRELQGELKRLSCYRGAIDGVWGDGSKQALADFLIASGNEKTFGNSVPVADAKKLMKSSSDQVCSLTSSVNQSTTAKRYKQAHNAYISACQEHFLIFPYLKTSDDCMQLEVERSALGRKLSEMNVPIPSE
jgi:hypothetical protein